MNKVFLVCIMIASVLVGCNTDQESESTYDKLSFSEVDNEVLNNDVLEFVNAVQEENGVHLYYEGQKAIYVYLNGSQVEQGGNAVHYSDFNAEEDGDTLNISYSEDETTDYSNQSYNLNLFYKIDLNKKYENVKGYRNGKETPFNVVSGNGE